MPHREPLLLPHPTAMEILQCTGVAELFSLPCLCLPHCAMQPVQYRRCMKKHSAKQTKKHVMRPQSRCWPTKRMKPLEFPVPSQAAMLPAARRIRRGHACTAYRSEIRQPAKVV
eukprot:UN4536